METVIGKEKEFLIIERDILTSLQKEISELKASPSVYSQGRANGIEYMVRWMKENNIYNEKNFHYLK